MQLKKSRHRLYLVGLVLVVVLLLLSFLEPGYKEVCRDVKYPQPDDCASYNAIAYFLLRTIEISNGISPALTAFATIFIGLFTWTLYRATTQQGELTKEALVVSTRAFVYLEDFTTWISTRSQRDRIVPDIGEFKFEPQWKNSGDTPTRNLSLYINHGVVEGELPDNFDYSYKNDPARAMIGPRAAEYGEIIEISDTDANRAFDKKGSTFVFGQPRNIYVWGKAEYEDAFGNTRYTRFCYRVDFQLREREFSAKFVPYGRHNRTDLDDAPRK